MANSGLFSSAGGDRGDKPNVLVVITDGKTNSGSKAYSSVLTPLIVSWVSFPSIISWLLKSCYSLSRISIGNRTASSSICTRDCMRRSCDVLLKVYSTKLRIAECLGWVSSSLRQTLTQVCVCVFRMTAIFVLLTFKSVAFGCAHAPLSRKQ